MTELGQITSERSYSEPTTVRLENLEEVRDRIANVLERGSYTSCTEHSLYSTKIETNQVLNKVGFWRDKDWGGIHIADSYGVWSVRINDTVAFASDSVIIQGFTGSGDWKKWTFTVEK
jgi:hypothetical protein